MATWILTATNLPLTGAANSNLSGSITLTGAMPADFDPQGITAIRLGRTLTVAGRGDDTVSDNLNIELVNGSGQVVESSSGTATNRTDGSWPYGPVTIEGNPVNKPSAANNAVRAVGAGAWATYTKIMSADGGVLSITAVTVEIDYTPGQGPVASFTADTTSVEQYQSVAVTSTSTNNPTDYSWSVSPGTMNVDWVIESPTSAATQIDFMKPGTYTVVLTASNNFGSNDSAPTQITVAKATRGALFDGANWVSGESWNGSQWVIPEVWNGAQWVPIGGS